MKACIVTFYNSLNYGAFLQAFTLKKVLSDLNYDVSFLNTKTRKPVSTGVKIVLKELLKFKFKEAYFELLKLIKCLSSIRSNFKVCNNEEDILKMFDLIVFGSDEIWNISRKDIRDYPILFGKGIPENYFISYAPSMNNTNLEQIKKNIEFQESIKRFNKISVRDFHSLNLLREITSKEIEVVLDPTLLIDKSIYAELEEECDKKDYILIYSYKNDFKSEQIREIKKFAKSVNLKLISVGFYNDWCDESVPASPFMFLSFMRNARFVITDTFHGTVFSIIYNKQFVTYAGKKLKIIDVLQRLNLESRNASERRIQLCNIFEEQINYYNVNGLLEEQIRTSNKYIQSSIENIRGQNNGNIA